MPDLPKVNKWIPETKRIILASDLRLLTIHDLGLFNRRFRFLFTNGRFVDLVGDPRTKSGLNIYRPPKDWRVLCKDAWKLKYLTKFELQQLRAAAVTYLQKSGGETTDMIAYHWLRHESNLPRHVFAAFNHFVFSVRNVSELLKIPID
jgi:hypothetical protein